MKEHFNHEKPESETDRSDSPEFSPEALARKESLLAGAQSIEEAADRLATEHPELAQDANKLKKKARRFMRMAPLVLYASYAIGGLVGAEYQEYNAEGYHVEEHVDKAGDITFSHQDPETTQVLDYLSGRGEMPRDVKRAEEAWKIRDLYKSLDQPLPAGIEKMDDASLSKTYDHGLFLLHKKYPKNIKYHPGKIDQDIPTTFERNDELYQALWNIERETGNPRIVMDMDESKADQGRSFRASYNRESNTMHIYYPPLKADVAQSRSEAIGAMVAESSHAQQFHGSFVGHIKNSIREERDVADVTNRAAVEHKSFDDAYDEREYDTPGTIENEAHTVIEPELKKQIPEEYREGQEKHKPGVADTSGNH